MQTQIQFVDVSSSEAIEARIQERIEKLERFFSFITTCNVRVRARRHSGRKIAGFDVQIEARIPNSEVFVNHKPGEVRAQADIYLAVRNAFDAMERRLSDTVRKMRGQVKIHDGPPQGRITKLFQADGYGFVSLADGKELYFHRNAVADDGFDDLAEGSAVSIAETDTPEGPHATYVKPINNMQLQGEPPAYYAEQSVAHQNEL